MMLIKIARILSACAMSVLLAAARPASSESWSLSNPHSSGTEPLTLVANKQPSVLDKIGTGTKNLLTATGQAVGLVKKTAKKTSKSKWPTSTFPASKSK